MVFKQILLVLAFSCMPVLRAMDLPVGEYRDHLVGVQENLFIDVEVNDVDFISYRVMSPRNVLLARAQVFKLSAHKVTILSLFVVPHCRGTGIGSFLLQRILDDASRIKDIKAVRLFASPLGADDLQQSLDTLETFYKRHGGTPGKICFEDGVRSGRNFQFLEAVKNRKKLPLITHPQYQMIPGE